MVNDGNIAIIKAITDKSSVDYLRDIPTSPLQKLMNMSQHSFNDVTGLSTPHSPELQQEKFAMLTANAGINLAALGITSASSSTPNTTGVQQVSSHGIG